MPFNLYTFILSDRFANEEFNKRNVPNPDGARRTALIASFLGPADGGGMNAAVIPAIIAKEAARREAESAEAQRLKDIQESLVPYTSVKGKPVLKAKTALATNFSVKVLDQHNQPLDANEFPDLVVDSQDPDPATTSTLAFGSEVTLKVKLPEQANP